MQSAVYRLSSYASFRYVPMYAKPDIPLQRLPQTAQWAADGSGSCKRKHLLTATVSHVTRATFSRSGQYVPLG